MSRKIIASLVFCLLLLLSGCGFHLRGDIAWPTPLKKIYIQQLPQDRRLNRELNHQLLAVGADVVPAAMDAPVTLKILSANFNQQANTLNTIAQVQTFNLIYTIWYQLTTASGAIITAPQQATASGSFTSSANQVLVDQNQEQVLQGQLINAAVIDLLTMLSSPQVINSVTSVSN